MSQLDKVAILASYSPRMVLERFREDITPPTEPTQLAFHGAVVFVDVSGFTKLSEALARQYGTKQGAEKLNEYINDYFRLLIDAIIDAGGDIIKFAGDALQVIWRVMPPSSSGGSSGGSGGGGGGGGGGGSGGASSSGGAARASSGDASPSAAAASAAATSAAAATGTEKTSGTETKDGLEEGSAALEAAVAEQVLLASRCCLSMLDGLHGFSPTPNVTLKLHMGIGCGQLMAYTVGGHLNKW